MFFDSTLSMCSLLYITLFSKKPHLITISVLLVHVLYIINLEAPVFLYGGGEIIDLFSNYIHLVQDLKLHCKWTIFYYKKIIIVF